MQRIMGWVGVYLGAGFFSFGLLAQNTELVFSSKDRADLTPGMVKTLRSLTSQNLHYTIVEPHKKNEKNKEKMIQTSRALLVFRELLLQGKLPENVEIKVKNDVPTDRIVVEAEPASEEEKQTKPASSSNSERATFYSIYYPFDGYLIPQESLTDLQKIADTAAQSIDILGFADHKGSKKYNTILSNLRALKVYESLVRRGVPPTDILIKGLGADDYVVPPGMNDKARRVDIKIILKQGAAFAVVEPVAVNAPSATVEQVPARGSLLATVEPVLARDQLSATVEEVPAKDSLLATVETVPVEESLTSTGEALLSLAEKKEPNHDIDAAYDRTFPLAFMRNYINSGNTLRLQYGYVLQRRGSSLVKARVYADTTRFIINREEREGDFRTIAGGLGLEWTRHHHAQWMDPYFTLILGVLKWNARVKNTTTNDSWTEGASELHLKYSAGVRKFISKDLFSIGPEIAGYISDGVFAAHIFSVGLVAGYYF